jgi:hypothetical protein
VCVVTDNVRPRASQWRRIIGLSKKSVVQFLSESSVRRYVAGLVLPLKVCKKSLSGQNKKAFCETRICSDILSRKKKFSEIFIGGENENSQPTP